MKNSFLIALLRDFLTSGGILLAVIYYKDLLAYPLSAGDQAGVIFIAMSFLFGLYLVLYHYGIRFDWTSYISPIFIIAGFIGLTSFTLDELALFGFHFSTESSTAISEYYWLKLVLNFWILVLSPVVLKLFLSRDAGSFK